MLAPFRGSKHLIIILESTIHHIYLIHLISKSCWLHCLNSSRVQPHLNTFTTTILVQAFLPPPLSPSQFMLHTLKKAYYGCCKLDHLTHNIFPGHYHSPLDLCDVSLISYIPVSCLLIPPATLPSLLTAPRINHARSWLTAFVLAWNPLTTDKDVVHSLLFIHISAWLSTYERGFLYPLCLKKRITPLCQFLSPTLFFILLIITTWQVTSMCMCV